ncbi:MAG: hypothetical protein OXN97_10600 [Bryobacterales bacterium]|nr:hypothetical protein [Bryobacterales bacterium]
MATPRHSAVLTQTLSELPDLRGNVMHDLHAAVLMREHGVSRICTLDRDFRRFEFLTVVDPLGKPRIRSWVRLPAIVARFAGRTPAFLDAGLR